MNRHNVPLLGLVVVAALGVACGTARGGEVGPTSVPVERDVAAVERAALADRYLALAGPLNLRVQDLARRIDQASDLGGMHDISLAYAAVESEFATGLRALTVPDDLKPMVVAAITAADQVASLNRRAAGGTDIAGVGGPLGV
ncbi:MAG TPA: hypothetical protein VGO64_08635, partial [Candidatus Limnocylindrales bacterium]|nr:hypothetical protein [Candidatus Limnocylindrales bacterium]